MNKERRCGAVFEKLGMTQIFLDDGGVVPVTLLKFNKNIVIDLKSEDTHGYNAVVIGYGISSKNKVNKPMKGIISKSGATDIKGIKEFRVSKEYFEDIGKEISIDYFILGQYVDATSISLGKGFSGAMKRHNFSGLEATHGVSISHRSHGSTGQREFPGKVFKGKKMAGQLGSEKKSLQNLKIVDIDKGLGIISVLGAVPGCKGGRVFLTDAVKKAIPSFSNQVD